MLLLRRRRAVPVVGFQAATQRWARVDPADAGRRDELTVATFNIWNDAYFAQQRYHAIAALLQRELPDVMVFQEVTPAALEVFTTQSWIRSDYLCAAVIGGQAGNYGLLMLTRLPVRGVTYTRLPTRLARGYLQAEFTINGSAQMIVSIHLDSGKTAAHLRARQLRHLFGRLRTADDAVVLGDFNMRDAENGQLDPAYLDAWQALRPDDDGFTEDTSINLMRFDSKSKHRQVRFDRVLVKGPAWAPADIELLGQEPISTTLPRVFPSDHFGVACRLVLRVSEPELTDGR